jgi:hypothetical protein
MSKVDIYRETLHRLVDWDAYLLSASNLPGPRANLELLDAVIKEGRPDDFLRWASLDAQQAPTNTPMEFLAACGTAGLGRLVAEGKREYIPMLRMAAADPRWRVREAVAIGLQRWGNMDMPGMLAEMRAWATMEPFEQRAAAAGACEPSLLIRPENARSTLKMLDSIMEHLPSLKERKGEGWRVLRQGLAYCWSVAVSALPNEGLPLMEKWLSSDDADVRWIMRENLKKTRLARIDPDWVERWKKLA